MAEETKRKRKTKIVWLNSAGTELVSDAGTAERNPEDAEGFRVATADGNFTLDVWPFKDYSDDIQRRLTLFGAKQRFTNAIGALTESEIAEEIQRIHDLQREGEWAAKREGGVQIGPLVDAVIALRAESGKPVADIEAMTEKIRAMTAEARKKLSTDPKVSAMVTRQLLAKKEKALAESAESVDLSDF